jgi:hypothetical protein
MFTIGDVMGSGLLSNTGSRQVMELFNKKTIGDNKWSVPVPSSAHYSERHGTGPVLSSPLCPLLGSWCGQGGGPTCEPPSHEADLRTRQFSK